MSNSPYQTTLNIAAATITAAGTDGPSATAINSIMQTVVGSGGCMLPTDAVAPAWYADRSGVNTVAVTIINASGNSIAIYTPDNALRYTLPANKTVRAEPGGQSSYAIIRLN
jgi:hypothetical protein